MGGRRWRRLSCMATLTACGAEKAAGEGDSLRSNREIEGGLSQE